jgi:PAS domain S-box-containing protein
VELINSTYEEFDRERQLTHRSIELASKELLELNRKIQDQSEARVQAIMDNVVDGIITFDEQGIIESFNPAAERIFGCSAAEIMRRKIYLLVPEIDEAESKFLHRKQGVGIETIGQRKDGSTFPIDLAISEMNFDEKSVFICVVRDITESKRVKDELRRLASFPVQNPNPIIEMDLSGNLHYMNPAAQRHFPDLNKTGNNHRIFEGVRSAIATFQREKYESVTYEVDLGDDIYEQKLWYTPESELLRIYMTDITERKRAEEALRERELYLKKQQAVLLELAKSEIFTDGDLETALRKITEASSRTIGVERVSVWIYKDNRSKISCVDLYEQSFDRHTDGLELAVDNAPTYFAAIQEKDCIVVHDAHGDSSTKELLAYYLTPFGISSLLDTPIRLGAQVVGILSHEHVGPVRQWSVEDQSFVRAIADIVSLTMEQLERSRAEEALNNNLAQLSKKSHYEAVISTVTQSVHQSINLQDVLENAVESMKQNIKRAENISIYMVEGDGELSRAEAVITAYRGYPDEFIKQAGRIPYPKGITWKTIIGGKPIYCPDIDQDTVIGPAGRAMGTKSYVSMPINYEGKTVGVININSFKKSAFDDDDLKLLENVAQQIEVAINNAQKAEALQKSEQKLAKQNKKLEEAYFKLEKQSAQLIQTEKMSTLGTMVAGVAHELNNPMMGILNFIQYCLKHTAKNDRKYDILMDAELEINRCQDIVQNLLTFSRIEKEGKEEYKKENCSVILDRVFKLLSYQIRKLGVSVTLQNAEETPDVFLRANNIQQVFLNLMTNALQALEDGEKKEINVDIRPAGEFIQITFVDSGCGIPRDKLSKIFDPFFTTKPVGQGTGLGLSLCLNIIEDHGGTITCESEVGVGTRFSILLPIERRKEVEMSKRVLVIDDDDSVRKSFLLALEDTEFHVDTAESGEKGIEKAKATNYNLVFLDLKMPGMNGVETLRKLRKSGHIWPVYIVTAFHKEFLDELKNIEEEGINFELAKKPLSSDQIVSITKSVLNGVLVV